MAQEPEWIGILSNLGGLTDDERAEAEMLIFDKPEPERLQFVSGAPERALRRVKALLRRAAGMDLPIHEAFDYCLLAYSLMSPCTCIQQQPAAW